MRQVTINLGGLYDQQEQVRDALNQGIRRIAFIGSVQVGKSYLGARLLLEQVFTNTNPDTNLLVCISPNHIMGRVMRREFEIVLQQTPELWTPVLKNRKQHPIPTYTFPNGKIVEFHSVDNPDTIRGLRPAFVLCDEASYFSEEAWDVIEGRTTQTGGPVVITTTPRGKRHWLYRRVFAKAAPPGHEDYNAQEYDPERYFMQVATIYDNPYIQDEEREAMIKTYGGPDSQLAQQELFGRFIEYKGLVYTSFNESTMVKNASEDMPNVWTYEFVMAGVDFGWNDPSTALCVGLKKGRWYVFQEYYRSETPIEQFGAVLSKMRADSNLLRFWADSADPGRIDLYMRMGLPVYPVIKPRINQRIQYINSLFAEGRIIISSDCTHLIHELTTYQWPENRVDRDESSLKPTGPDHALDALAYALWSERTMLSTTSARFDNMPSDWGKPFRPNAVHELPDADRMSAGYWD